MSTVQAILSIRFDVERQGTAVGEPLGARQVAVMILRGGAHMLQNS